MTEKIEIEEVESNSQSVQSDDDSGSDLGEGDVVEKEERRIYQPIEFDLSDPKNTFVIDFVSLQPEQQKADNAAGPAVPAVPVSGSAVPSEGAGELKKKEPNPALFSNRMTSVIQRIEQIYATAADLGYDSDSFIDDDELFDEENDAAAEEEALYQGFYINKGELETKKRSREEHEESDEPAKKKRRVESGEGKQREDKEERPKQRKKSGKKSEVDAAKNELKVDAAAQKKKKKAPSAGAEEPSKKRKSAGEGASPDKKKSVASTEQQPFRTSPLFEERFAQLAAAARQFVERHLAEQQTAATTATSPATGPAKEGEDKKKDKGVRFPRRLEPKLLLVAQALQPLYPKHPFPDVVIQRIAEPFAPVFKADSVRQRILRLLQQHKPEQIDEKTELGQLLKIRRHLLAKFNERLQVLCNKLKRTVLPGEPPPRWTWSDEFKRWVGDIIELEKGIVTLRASESEGKSEPGKESKPVDMNKALKKVYAELSAMWPEGWITNQRIATAVKSRGTDLRSPAELIAYHTPYMTGEKVEMIDVQTAQYPPYTHTGAPPQTVRSSGSTPATQASVQGLPNGVSFSQLTGLGWAGPSSSAQLPGTFSPHYLHFPQQTMYSQKPGEFTYYQPPPQ